MSRFIPCLCLWLLASGFGFDAQAAESRGRADDPFAAFDGRTPDKPKKRRAKRRKARSGKAPKSDKALEVDAMTKDLYATLTVGTTYTHVPEPRPGLADGNVAHAEAKVRASYGLLSFTVLGRCEQFGTDRSSPKPTVPHAEGRGTGCLLKESFLDVGDESAHLTLGKQAIELGQAVLTSPANPSTAGRITGSPVETQEGVWTAKIEWVPSEHFTITGGLAQHEDRLLLGRNGDDDPDSPTLAESRRRQRYERETSEYRAIEIHPFATATISTERVDLYASATVNFSGAGLTLMPFSGVFLYAEGNAYLPADPAVADLYARSDEDDTRAEMLHDGVAGLKIAPGGWRYALAVERLRNAQGLPGPASEERYLEAQTYREDVGRRHVFAFPTRAGQTPLWGATDFMSRDLVFLSLYPESKGGFLVTALASLDDRSGRYSAGYTLVNPFPAFGGEWRVGLEAVRLDGARFSEFGETREFVGDDALILTLEI